MFACSRANFPLQNSNGLKMDQLPDILQQSVHSLSDSSNLDPTTDTSQNRRRVHRPRFSGRNRFTLFRQLLGETTEGDNYGYFPESSKSSPSVETGSRYSGSFLVKPRKEPVRSQAGAARVYPQSAHSVLHRPGQQECQYLQRTTPSIESCFDLLEKAMLDDFLPALFEEATDGSEYRLELAHLSMKFSGLALLNTLNSDGIRALAAHFQHKSESRSCPSFP